MCAKSGMSGLTVADGAMVGISVGVALATTGVVVADDNGVSVAIDAVAGTGEGPPALSEQAATKTSINPTGRKRRT